MTVEELRALAKSMGYNIVKIKPYEKFLPCICGNNRREEWFGNDGREIIYKCTKCGFGVFGKNRADAKHNWNINVESIMKEKQCQDMK